MDLSNFKKHEKYNINYEDLMCRLWEVDWTKYFHDAEVKDLVKEAKQNILKKYSSSIIKILKENRMRYSNAQLIEALKYTISSNIGIKKNDVIYIENPCRLDMWAEDLTQIVDLNIHCPQEAYSILRNMWCQELCKCGSDCAKEILRIDDYSEIDSVLQVKERHIHMLTKLGWGFINYDPVYSYKASGSSSFSGGGSIFGSHISGGGSFSAEGKKTHNEYLMKKTGQIAPPPDKS